MATCEPIRTLEGGKTGITFEGCETWQAIYPAFAPAQSGFPTKPREYVDAGRVGPIPTAPFQDKDFHSKFLKAAQAPEGLVARGETIRKQILDLAEKDGNEKTLSAADLTDLPPDEADEVVAYAVVMSENFQGVAEGEMLSGLNERIQQLANNAWWQGAGYGALAGASLVWGVVAVRNRRRSKAAPAQTSAVMGTPPRTFPVSRAHWYSLPQFSPGWGARLGWRVANKSPLKWIPGVRSWVQRNYARRIEVPAATSELQFRLGQYRALPENLRGPAELEIVKGAFGRLTEAQNRAGMVPMPPQELSGLLPAATAPQPPAAEAAEAPQRNSRRKGANGHDPAAASAAPAATPAEGRRARRARGGGNGERAGR